MNKRISIVLVSHSRLIAEGTKELAQAMAPDIHIGATGGNPDGGLGSSYDIIEAVIEEARLASGDSGVVVLTDLGSTTMTVDAVIDMAEEGFKVTRAPGPLVEGAVAAAVAASQGGDMDAVVNSVIDTAKLLWEESGQARTTAPEPDTEASAGAAEMEVTVGDPAGLHARSAAILAREAAGYSAKIRVNGALATSVVDILSQGINYGDRVTVHVEGANAEQILKEITDGISSGFDETPSQPQ